MNRVHNIADLGGMVKIASLRRTARHSEWAHKLLAWHDAGKAWSDKQLALANKLTRC